VKYLADKRRFFEENLGNFLPHPGSYPQILRQAMEYSLFAGGKRFRPILTLATAEACGGDLRSALTPAAALEMIHTYSLIHDDLPAMDDDDLRRGKPTCHKVFGDAMAILAGDALLTHAFSVVVDSQDLNSHQTMAIIRELAAAAGPRGMVAGQALDIGGMEKDPALLNYIHSCKTGALIKAAVRVGAISADASPKVVEGLSEYAAALGLAYQIVDDILDVQGTTKELGKGAGSDAKSGKQTFVTIYGLEGAKQMAAAETQRAIRALASINGEFRQLHDLGMYIGQRTS
jgi:geranylgeranyl diphosphate synthase type II